MEEIYEKYRAQGVEFIVAYTHEPHPGKHYGPHESMEQKQSYAEDMVREENIGRRVLIDDLAGTMHRAYGGWPNMIYVLDGAGIIRYRAIWNDPDRVEAVLDALLAGELESDAFGEDTGMVPGRSPVFRVFRRAGWDAAWDFFAAMPLMIIQRLTWRVWGRRLAHIPKTRP
ncbi:MAG: peroxiredoxin family protein [Anaerolineae bacterium]